MKEILLIILAILICAIILMLLYKNLPSKVKYIESSRVVKADEVREIKYIEKVEIPIEKIKIIPKDKVKEVPVEIKDTKKEILTITEIRNCPDGAKVFSVIDTEKKEGELYIKKNERKIFEFVNSREIGINYGIGFDGQEIRIIGRWDIYRIKDLRIGVDGEWGKNMGKIMLKLSYSF